VRSNVDALRGSGDALRRGHVQIDVQRRPAHHLRSPHGDAELDCGARTTGGTCGEPFTCVETRANGCDGLGLGCVAGSEATACDVLDNVLCGPDRSCVIEFEERRGSEGRCRARASMACAPGVPHVGCAGDIAPFCLSGPNHTVAEASGFDCASFGGTCTLNANGEPICAGGENGRCIDQIVDPNTPFTCAEGFTCAGGEGTFGNCLPDGTPMPDAGVESDGGMTGGADAGMMMNMKQPSEGCDCSTSDPASGAPALALLFALALSIRRRRG
jgi:MYXO-CTERM domain-containing protein